MGRFLSIPRSSLTTLRMFSVVRVRGSGHQKNNSAQLLLWMDEILHHLRNPGMMLPCKYQQTMVSLGFKAVQDFVHPQY